MSEPFDLLVIGGGANGAGIARDAAGRGYRVLLCEKGDLGEGTSSRSGTAGSRSRSSSPPMNPASTAARDSTGQCTGSG